MKKFFIAFVLLVALLIPSVQADNTVILNRVQVSDNNIKLSINQGLGFVTSYNLKVKIQGNGVKLKKVNFDSSIKANDYKNYIYNTTTGELDIYVVSKNNENLVNQNGVINIGIIEIEANNGTEYNIVINKDKAENVVLVNNNFDKIIATSTSNNNEDKFVAKSNSGGTIENPSTSPSQNPSTNPSSNPSTNPSTSASSKPSGNNNNNSNNANNNNSSSSSNNNNNSNSASVFTSENPSTSINTSASSDGFLGNPENVSTSSSNYNDLENINKKESEGLSFFVSLVIAIVVVAVVIGVIYIVIRIKNK